MVKVKKMTKSEKLIFLLYRKKTKQTEEHLIVGDEVIPWSNIDHISVKQSALGNSYLAFYFRDDTPPRSFDMAYLANVEELFNCLRYNAAEKGFTLTIEGQVEVYEEDDSQMEGFRKRKEDVKREIDQKEKEKGEREQEKKKPQIKISSRQKSFLIIFLAIVFFLGLYIVIGIKFALSLFIIVLVHEGGHLVALKLFHMKVHGLYFIPFIGAAVVPKEDFPSPEAEAAVALAGPVAGLSWNLAAHLIKMPRYVHFSPFSGQISFHELFIYIVILNLGFNLLNLLPTLPLDGGRIMRAALLRGRKSLVPVTIITIGSGVAAGVYLKSVFFVVIAVFGLSSLVYSYKRMEKREVEPPAWWKSVVILGAWVTITYSYWYALPHHIRITIKMLLELFNFPE